jgi:hypothetical protein
LICAFFAPVVIVTLPVPSTPAPAEANSRDAVTSPRASCLTKTLCTVASASEDAATATWPSLELAVSGWTWLGSASPRMAVPRAARAVDRLPTMDFWLPRSDCCCVIALAGARSALTSWVISEALSIPLARPVNVTAGMVGS